MQQASAAQQAHQHGLAFGQPVMRITLGARGGGGRRPMTTSPGEFFSNHPKLYRVSLLCASAAGIGFTIRARRASGSGRLGWMILAALQAAQVIGIATTKVAASRHGAGAA